MALGAQWKQILEKKMCFFTPEMTEIQRTKFESSKKQRCKLFATSRNFSLKHPFWTFWFCDARRSRMTFRSMNQAWILHKKGVSDKNDAFWCFRRCFLSPNLKSWIMQKCDFSCKKHILIKRCVSKNSHPCSNFHFF